MTRAVTADERIEELEFVLQMLYIDPHPDDVVRQRAFNLILESALAGIGVPEHLELPMMTFEWEDGFSVASATVEVLTDTPDGWRVSVNRAEGDDIENNAGVWNASPRSLANGLLVFFTRLCDE